MAIAKYLQWKEQRHSSSLGVLRVHSDAYSAMIDMCRRTIAAGGSRQADIAASEGQPTSYALRDHTLNAAQWAWLRQQLITRRQWVAQMVGVEQIAYLPELKKPTPSPTLSEVGKVYTDRGDITQKETQKVGATWQGFCRDAGVQTLRDLTPEAVAAWGAAVKKQGLSAKSIYHRFNRVKTVLNYFRTTRRALDDVRHALDCCAVLRAPETTSLDPRPISRENFATLVAAADSGEEKAMLLVAMNLCFYPIDLARLRWPELDLDRGVYHAKRGKTKVARCGVLWSRTVEELAKLSRREDDGFVFHRAIRAPAHRHDDPEVVLETTCAGGGRGARAVRRHPRRQLHRGGRRRRG